jgi:hypothetical protein
MSLIDLQPAEAASGETSSYRKNTVSTKLSDDENSMLETLAQRRKQTSSSLVRDLVLAELERNGAKQQADLVLSEIVGVRLLLVNLLRPRDDHDALTTETFDLLVDEIKRVKKQVASELNQKEEVW